MGVEVPSVGLAVGAGKRAEVVVGADVRRGVADDEERGDERGGGRRRRRGPRSRGGCGEG